MIACILESRRVWGKGESVEGLFMKCVDASVIDLANTDPCRSRLAGDEARKITADGEAADEVFARQQRTGRLLRYQRVSTAFFGPKCLFPGAAQKLQ